MNVKKVNIGRNNHIYLKKTKKFKTIGISFVFKMKYDHKNVTAFNVLAKYLGNCCADYPSIEKLNKYIESLYGTELGIKTSYSGSLFKLNIFANYVNPKFIDDKDLTNKVLEIISKIIYKPLIVDDKFDDTIFSICKENCMIDTESLNEYNMGYVIRRLKNSITSDPFNAFNTPTLGDQKVLKKLNNYNIAKYYKRILSAPFDVYVTGDFSYKEMIETIKKHFAHHKAKNFKYDVFDMIKDKVVEPTIIKKQVSQAKVAVAYKIPILFNDERHYAFRLARLVLSGTLSAKFGKVIREQMGLCYFINSVYSSYYGTFIVSTGVASENIEKVVKEIDNQIKELQNGNLTDEEFNQAKEAILSDMSSIDDSLFGTLNMIKTYHYFNQDFVLEKEIEKYKKVSKEDIIKVSKLLTYCTYAALDKE